MTVSLDYSIAYRRGFSRAGSSFIQILNSSQMIEVRDGPLYVTQHSRTILVVMWYVIQQNARTMANQIMRTPEQRERMMLV
jgi:hypothetical protein